MPMLALRSPVRALGTLAMALLAACGTGGTGTFLGDSGSPEGGSMMTGNDAAVTVDASGRRCARQADCDDNIPCTEDACVVGGVCENTPIDSMCPMGQRCTLSRGCSDGMTCARNEDCNDSVMCTRDLCAAGGVCSHVRDDSLCRGGEVCSATGGCIAMGRCAGANDCDDGRFCNGTEVCTNGMCASGTPPDCADTDTCTADLCEEVRRMCVHTALPMCGGTVTPGTYALTPSVQYSCGSGSLGPISQMQLMVNAGGVTVTGFPATLTGQAPMNGMFSATGRFPMGSCQWVLTVSGAFTMPNRFDGSWNLSFDNCVLTLGCFSQFGRLTGTMR